MPHATHFLERLDRVPRALTDLALDLYRDEAKVGWILHYAHLAKDVERVALALDPAGGGPYIVVTRDGKFVTALGAEMTPTNLTILSRAQVDAFSARVEEARARRELAAAMVPPGKEPHDVLGLLKSRARRITRREFSAMAAWAPLLGGKILTDVYASIDLAEETLQAFLGGLQTRHAKDPHVRLLRDALWNSAHATGTRLLLATMGDLAIAEPLSDIWTPDFGPTFPATRERIHSVMVRGAWASARLGRHFIPTHKRILATSDDPLIRFDSAVAVTAIGVRHARHREEARRIVSAMLDGPDDANRAWRESVVAASERALTDPEGATSEVVSFGAQTAVVLGQYLPAGSPFKFARIEDVPREAALLVAANSLHDPMNPLTMLSLAWVAKLKNPEDLYFPDDMGEAFGIPYPAPLIDEILTRGRNFKNEPVTNATPKPGRNDPCTCGSGAKYKKCCGR